jgi:TetR/AcrR family transcriptional regulator, cholesterol catabolism regulator
LPSTDSGSDKTILAIVADGKAEMERTRIRWRLSQFREAAKSVIAEKGYGGMTMQDLAETADVSVGLVYQYVKSKEDVLMLVIEDLMDTYRSAISDAVSAQDDPVESLAAGFMAYASVVDRYRAVTSVGYREYGGFSPGGRKQAQQWELESNRLLEELVERCIETGAFREVDPHLVAYDLVLLAHMWSLKHWDLGRRMSLEQFASHQIAMVVEACLSPRQRDKYCALTDSLTQFDGSLATAEKGNKNRDG